MARRKTHSVAALIEQANYSLEHDEHGPEFRKGVMMMLEKVLFDTGNYKGFRYLTEEEVPKGQEPGIRKVAEKNVFPDTTRVRYYT